MATQIQLRRATAANWVSDDPVLAEGEFGYEKDTRLYKIGNGVLNWNELPYASSSYSVTASFALNSGGSGTTLSTGSTYPITSSWSVNSRTASLAPNYQIIIATGSTVPFTSSWATTAITANTASRVGVSTTNTNAEYNIPFVVGNGTHPLLIDNDTLKFNPSTNILTLGGVVPFVDGVYNLGTSTEKWNILYSNTITASSTIFTNLNVGSSDNTYPVYFNTTAAEAFRVHRTTANQSSILFTNASGFRGAMGIGDTGHLHFGSIFGLLANAAMTIRSGSLVQVGVNTTNPTTTLHVFGHISSSAITSSLFGTASWATNVVNSGGSLLTSGSTYNITSSWAMTSSNANSINIIQASDSGAYYIYFGPNTSGYNSSFVNSGITLGLPTKLLTVTSSNALTSSALKSYHFLSGSISDSGGTYIITNEDDGKLISMGTTNGRIWVSGSILQPYFNCTFYQSSSAQLSFTASSGTTITNRSGHVKSAGQYALLTLIRINNREFVLGGDTSA